MKKRFACLLLLLIIKTNFFGYSGYLSGESDLQIIKTEWFEFIFPQGCEHTAFILSENADSLFEQLSAEFGTEPDFRMPVVITPGNEQFNAYWSSYPYNHIVIFDTAMIEDLAVFSDTILSTFKHELTHAVTYNLKSPEFKAVGKIFGDSISAAPWLVTSGMAEGATVSIESKNGEGRLNDEFAMQNVKQAKIQNQFPAYFDVQISTDIYPYGQFYYFNGAFNNWLQENYGMEKYAKLWYTCVNLGALTIKNAFKKVYGVSLDSLWQQFIKDFYVPENLESNPEEAGQTRNIFANKTINESGRVFSSLSSNKAGIYYLDEETDTVFFILWNQITNSEKGGAKPKKIFTKRNIQSVKCSNDNRFLVYDYFVTNEGNVKKSAGIYDLTNHSFFDVNETGIEDGFIVKKDDAYYFGCKTFNSQNYGISFYLIEEKNNKISSLKKLWNRYFDFEVYPYNFVQSSEESFAFICKDKKIFSIVQWDLSGNEIKNYGFSDEGIVVRYLSPVIGQNNNFAFTWTKKDSLPRLGFFNLENQQFLLMKEDISGGIYFPEVMIEEKEQHIVYAAHLYNQTKMFELEKNYDYETSKAKKLAEIQTKENNDDFFVINSERYSAEKYKALKNLNKGVIIPATQLVSTSFDGFHNDGSIPLGITYITSNPWDSNLLALQAGYSPWLNSGAFQIDYSDGTATSLFSYHLSDYIELDGAGFKQTFGTFDFSTAIPMGNISYFVAGINQYDYFGRAGTASDISDNYFYNGSSCYAGIQSIFKAGPGRYERAGYSLTAIFSYQYLKQFGTSGTDVHADFYDLGFNTSLFIPHLIPIECNRNFVYNFPLSIKANLFSGVSGQNLSSDGKIFWGGYSLSEIYALNGLSVESELVLFGYEIQKAVSFFNFLYAGELKISLQYYGGFDLPGSSYNSCMHIVNIPEYFNMLGTNQLQWQNYYALNFELGITPIVLNIGKINFSAKIIPDFVNKDCFFSFSAKLQV